MDTPPEEPGRRQPRRAQPDRQLAGIPAQLYLAIAGRVEQRDPRGDPAQHLELAGVEDAGSVKEQDHRQDPVDSAPRGRVAGVGRVLQQAGGADSAQLGGAQELGPRQLQEQQALRKNSAGRVLQQTFCQGLRQQSVPMRSAFETLQQGHSLMTLSLLRHGLGSWISRLDWNN